MAYYEISATLLTPCCMSEQPAMGNEVETLDYIPGTALRGMLADMYLRKGGQADETFRGVFCSDAISFPNLYPINCHPLPLSAYTCKRHPGFTNDEPSGTWDEPPHGVWNLLFEGADDFTLTCRERRHQEDAGPLKPHGNRWYDSDRNTGEAVPQLLITRTAIHTPSGSALEGSLHSQQELAAGSTFTGTLLARDTTVPNDTKKFVDVLFDQFGGLDGEGIIAYTGRRRAGQIEIRFNTFSGELPKPCFFDTWPKPAQTDRCYFALTFTSDVILIDRLLRPIVTLDKDSKVLKDEMEFPRDVEACVEKAFVRTRRVSGWNAVAQIFKPDDMAMVMGSTFLVRIKQSDQQKIRNWMQRRIEGGVGLRRSEGFGRVRFDEPFHCKAAEKNGGPL
jgi:CRISPR-associated protein Csx10